MSVVTAAVSDELQTRRQWVCWRSETRDGKPTKVPYSPDGRRADTTEPETWGRYEEAVEARKSGRYDGIGFVFAADDPFVGVDLDDCRNPEAGELESWARAIISELDSYTELSPTGTGVHIILRGEKTTDRCRKGKWFECYAQKRFFTITGQHLQGTPKTIESRQDALDSVLRRVFPAANPDGQGPPVEAPGGSQGLQDVSDEEVIRRAHAAANGEKFARLWAGDASDYDSPSEADAALCALLAFWAGPNETRIDALFRRSGLCREKWTGRADYRERTIAAALQGRTEFYSPPGSAPGKDAAGEAPGGGKPTQAELLIQCADGADLFHTPAGDAYATVPTGGHHETHPIKSKGFRRWLVRAFYGLQGRPPSAQALQDALGLLEARAEFDGPERPVFVRVAEHDGAIYLDLADEGWRVVEITPSGWRTVAGDAAPVRFRRPRGLLPLPAPAEAGEGVDGLLRRFLNVSGDEDLRLVVAWLMAALRPTGPYPVLLLQGEQGSAKSTAERLLRALVDPSAAPLRTTPRNEHDLFIAADNAHVIALDNISTLQPWLSDALCRLSTGGGFSTRMLYEGREEELFEGVRPIAMNGITDIATRPDLLDRSLIVTLPTIPEDKRRDEKELWKDFYETRPALLGALLDGVSGALAAVEDVRLEGLPRMADFALWSVAAESSLGWASGAFLAAYTGNREAAADTALEADPVAEAVQRLMETRDEWVGTATELWTALGEEVDEDVKRAKIWPGAPNALTSRLKRLAPTLRSTGIEYGERRAPGGSRTRRKVLTKNTGAKDRPDRPDRPGDKETPANGEKGGGTVSGTAGRSGGETVPETVPDESPANADIRDDGDGRDDDLRPYSNPPADPRFGFSEDFEKQPPDAWLNTPLDELRKRYPGPADVPAAVREVLSNPPRYLVRQLNVAREQGYPPSLMYAAAGAVAHEVFGDSRRYRKVLSAVEAFLTHDLDCECEECL